MLSLAEMLSILLSLVVEAEEALPIAAAVALEA
jgi:hypothetical protein